MINFIAVIVCIVALVMALAAVAYLAMFSSVAKKKGAVGSAVSADLRKRWPHVIGSLVGAVIALLFTRGGAGLDWAGLVIGVVSGVSASKALTSVRNDYRSS